MSFRRILILGVPLLVGVVVLAGTERRIPSLAKTVEASPCKGTQGTCRTPQSCCSRRCFKEEGAKFGDCRPPCGSCGDGFLDPSCGEQCDDGNTAACDGCSATCEIEPSCDDGVLCTRDSCNATTGACVNEPDDTFCDDGDESTTDTCDPDCSRELSSCNPETGCSNTGGGCGCS